MYVTISDRGKFSSLDDISFPCNIYVYMLDLCAKVAQKVLTSSSSNGNNSYC